MSSKYLVQRSGRPAPVGTVAPVAAVTHRQLLDALDPLMALLGTAHDAVLAGSLEIRLDEWRISFMSCTPVAGVEPVPYGGDVVEGGGIAPNAIWAWPVTVEVVPAVAVAGIPLVGLTDTAP